MEGTLRFRDEIFSSFVFLAEVPVRMINLSGHLASPLPVWFERSTLRWFMFKPVKTKSGLDVMEKKPQEDVVKSKWEKSIESNKKIIIRI